MHSVAHIPEHNIPNLKPQLYLNLNGFLTSDPNPGFNFQTVTTKQNVPTSQGCPQPQGLKLKLVQRYKSEGLLFKNPINFDVFYEFIYFQLFSA